MLKHLFGKREPEKTPLAKVAESVPLLRIAIGVGGLAALWAISGLIWAAVSAAMGIVAIGVVALVGIGLFQAIPLLSQKWENRILAARIREARERPIEQLQNLLLSRTKTLEAFKQATVTMKTQISGLEDMVRERKSRSKDVSRQEQAIAAVTEVYRNRVAKYQAGVAALDEFKEQIEDAKFEFNFGAAYEQTKKSAGESEKDLLDSMLGNEAFSAARDKFNRVFADLDLEIAEINSSKKIEYAPGVTLDLTAVEIPQRQLVGVH